MGALKVRGEFEQLPDGRLRLVLEPVDDGEQEEKPTPADKKKRDEEKPAVERIPIQCPAPGCGTLMDPEGQCPRCGYKKAKP